MGNQSSSSVDEDIEISSTVDSLTEFRLNSWQRKGIGSKSLPTDSDASTLFAVYPTDAKADTKGNGPDDGGIGDMTASPQQRAFTDDWNKLQYHTQLLNNLGAFPHPQVRTAGSGLTRSQSFDSASGTSNSSEPWGWFHDDFELNGSRGMGNTNRSFRDVNREEIQIQIVRAEEEATSKQQMQKTEQAEHVDETAQQKEDMTTNGSNDTIFHLPHLQRTLSLPVPQSMPPQYVIESSMEFQLLWYATAGKRPPQPKEERDYYMSLWQDQMQHHSLVQYNEDKKDTTTNNTTASVGGGGGGSPRKCIDIDTGYEILYTGTNPNSYMVSKSFVDDPLAALSIQLPRIRIVKNQDGVIFAEFLIETSVIVQGVGKAVIFGIWKRHSQFQELAKKIRLIQDRCTAAFNEIRTARYGSAGGDDSSSSSSDDDGKEYENSVLSWQCVVARQAWFRCLEKEYVALKCFLLERFLHDVLFESTSSALLRQFLQLS